MNETKQTRRDFLRTTATAAAAASLSSASALAPRVSRASALRTAPSPRPNILYILTDQWRAQALSCAGDPNIQTNNIDALALAGVRFSHCYSNSPLCTPHRSMVQSGRWMSRTGNWVNDTLMPPEEYCLAEAFGDADYSTGYIGKWHLDGPPKPGYVQYRQGWQWWAGFNRGHDYFPPSVYFMADATELYIPDGSFQATFQTDMAIDWLNGRAGQTNPFFLMISFGGPHTPYTAPTNYLNLFDKSTFVLRPNVPAANDAAARTDLRGYYAHCKCLDDNIGRLVQTLLDNGFTDNTLICFTADHGDMLYSQGQQVKSKPWEESANVPFIAKWPQSVPGGRTLDALFCSIDIYPTLCGLAGVPIPSGKDGVDYSHLFRGEAGPERESVSLTIGEPTAASPWRGVVTPTHTYAWRPKQGTGWVLYNNVTDQYQMNNLIGQAGSEALEEQMRRLALRWMRAYDDPLRAVVPGSDVPRWRLY